MTLIANIPQPTAGQQIRTVNTNEHTPSRGPTMTASTAERWNQAEGIRCPEYGQDHQQFPRYELL